MVAHIALILFIRSSNGGVDMRLDSDKVQIFCSIISTL